MMLLAYIAFAYGATAVAEALGAPRPLGLAAVGAAIYLMESRRQARHPG